jgi:hypothetical protein
MYIFLAPSLAWLPVVVALDHPQDDHLHAVCAIQDKPATAIAAPPFRVPRPLIFHHVDQTLKFCAGEHAQMLMSDGMAYACQVWVKVIIQKVWKQGFAVVTICAESREVIAQKVTRCLARLLLELTFPQHCLRSDSMVPMHQDLSFSSLVSEIVPVRKSSCRTPSCRGRSVGTTSRAAGRIGDVAPDTSDLTFPHASVDPVPVAAEMPDTQGREMSGDDDTHSLEIEIVRNAPPPPHPHSLLFREKSIDPASAAGNS